ncbi:MAG: hypothetical protein ABEJ72_05220 [Candidatus Aenigmatarchaeota archaeon]
MAENSASNSSQGKSSETFSRIPVIIYSVYILGAFNLGLILLLDKAYTTGLSIWGFLFGLFALLEYETWWGKIR